MQPLSRIRVLDLTRLLPGPWATMLLADLGADVIKVENPGSGGDASRHSKPRYGTGPRSESVYFCNVNRNKRSVNLDLKTQTGREAFYALVETADVVVESSRPGTAASLGVAYEDLRKIRPSLIYCSMSGYGQDGPLASLAGHDLNIAGLSGLLQRSPDETPVMPNMLMGDYAGGTMVAIGILAALVDRERHGRGAFLDVSMLDGLVSWTAVQMCEAFVRMVDPKAKGAIEGWGENPRYSIYRTRDGRYVTASLLEKKYWDAFCRLNGREDLINPNETEADRLTSHGERGAAYREFLTAIFLTKDRDAWAQDMMRLEIPVCPVLTPEEVPRSEQAKARGQFNDVYSRTLERTIPQLGFPFAMTSSDGSNAFSVRQGPPVLGEADREILPAGEGRRS